MPHKISRTLEVAVRKRANGLCEYCHTIERWQYVPFTVDHILAVHLGGTTILENLAQACFRCNRLKGWRLSGIDPQTGDDEPLFNPRRDRWVEHFCWSADGSLLIARSAIGQATIALLDMNRPRVVEIRLADVMIGRHPPLGDPREGQ